MLPSPETLALFLPLPSTPPKWRTLLFGNLEMLYSKESTWSLIRRGARSHSKCGGGVEERLPVLVSDNCFHPFVTVI